MKIETIIKMLKSGKKPLVKLTDELWDESWGQKEMLAEITEYRYENEEEGHFTFDYNKHKNHNLALQPRGYYLDTDTGRTGTAFEAGIMDEKDIKEEICLMLNNDIPCVIPDTNSLMQTYIHSKSPLSYVEWLEKELTELRKEHENYVYHIERLKMS